MADLTLDRMAAGGIYDQLGGGFHRYAVDAIWLVPHFEKMLYDNALLASAYLHAFAITGKERYREVVEETLDYLLREMLLPEGGFASAQDADTNGEEGLTYVWTLDELDAVLEPDEARPSPRATASRRRATSRAPPSSPWSTATWTWLPRRVAGCSTARLRRPQPARDDKALAAWNGYTLAAFAEAGLRLHRPDYVDAARALADFLLETMTDERGRLLRTYRAGQAKIAGYLDDYANVANGLLELYAATGEHRHLAEANRIARLAIELFADDHRGGFFFTPADGEQLVARKKELDDNPTPSGSSMLAWVLLRLSRIYGDGELERRAVEVFRLAYRYIERAPAAVGWLMCGLELHFAPPQEVAIVGPADDPATEALRDAAFARFEPNAVYAFAEGADDPAASRGPAARGQGARRRPAGRVRVPGLRVSCAGHGSRRAGGGARRRADPRPL